MKGTLPVWVANGSPFFRDGLKHVLRRPRFTVERTGTSLGELVDAAIPAPAIVIFRNVAEPELETLIERIKGQCEPPEVTRFVLLLDEENQLALPATLKPLIDAVLPKNMPPEALAHFLEIVLLGQPLFVTAPDRWRSDSGTPTGGISQAPSLGELRIGGAPAPPGGIAVPFDERRVLLERIHTSDDGALRLKIPVVGDYEIGLSERENQILQCLRKGASNKVIARQLQIAESTVKVHIKSVLKKLRLNNRTQAAIWATENPTPHGAAATPLRVDHGSTPLAQQ